MRIQSEILLLFLLFKVSLLFGQTRQDIVAENKSWSIVNYNPSQGPNCTWQTYEIRLAGDTVINNSEYKVVEQSEFGLHPNNWEVVGFIREDSVKKVYFNNNFNEVLLYDFNVSPGDIVNISSPYINPFTLQFEFFNYLQMSVVSIDSVIINEEFKKIIELNPICTSFQKTYWIESIGDTKGILNNIVPMACIGDSIVVDWQGASVNELLCCKVDSLILFNNPSYNSCYYYSTAGIYEKKNNISIKIYPNPIVDISTFEITNQQSELKYLEFYNITGKKVKTIETKENKIIIDRLDFKNGFYIYKLIIENKQTKVGKIIMK